MAYGSLRLGSGKYLYLPTGTATHLYPGTSAFTVEAYVYIQSNSWYNMIVSAGNTSTVYSNDWFFGVDNDAGSNLMYGVGTTNYLASQGQTVTLNQWCHVALTRQSNGVMTTFVDGVIAGLTFTNTTNFNLASEFRIGRGRQSSSNYFDGWIANLHMVIGDALYTDTFTPPTDPFTATANTRLLISPELSGNVVDLSSYDAQFTASAGNSAMSVFNPWDYVAPTSSANDSVNFSTFISSANVKKIIYASSTDALVNKSVVDPEEAYYQT